MNSWLGIVVQACSPRTGEAEAGDCCEFESCSETLTHNTTLRKSGHQEESQANFCKVLNPQAPGLSDRGNPWSQAYEVSCRQELSVTPQSKLRKVLGEPLLYPEVSIAKAEDLLSPSHTSIWRFARPTQ